MIARQFAGQTRNVKGKRFWVRGYVVSTLVHHVKPIVGWHQFL